MKTKLFICIAIVSLLSITTTFGQITNIKVSDQVTIDKVYAGSLSAVNFSTDSLNATGSTGIRFGIMATYKPTNWISFGSYAMMQIDNGKNPWSLQQFWASIKPIKNLGIDFGSMGSLPTELRPHPVSAGGQFETWAQSQIPGGGLGAKVKYQISKDFQFGGGIVMRNKLAEYSSKVTYKNVQITSWYSEYNKKFGAATVINSGRISTTFAWKQDQTLADMLVIELSKKESISLYSDMGYNLTNKNLIRGEIGIFKGFDSKWVDGLISASYDVKAHSVNGYLFVHL